MLRLGLVFAGAGLVAGAAPGLRGAAEPDYDAAVLTSLPVPPPPPPFETLGYHGHIENAPAAFASIVFVADFEEHNTVDFGIYDEVDELARTECSRQPFRFDGTAVHLAGAATGCVADALGRLKLQLREMRYRSDGDQLEVDLTAVDGTALRAVLHLGMPQLTPASPSEEPDDLEALAFAVLPYYGRVIKAPPAYAKLVFVAEFRRDGIVDLSGFHDDHEEDVTECPAEPYTYEDGVLTLEGAFNVASCIAESLRAVHLAIHDFRYLIGANHFLVTFYDPEGNPLRVLLQPGRPF